MTASDNVPFYLNEIFISGDQTTQNAIGARWLTDTLRYLQGQPNADIVTDAPTQDSQTNVVLGGLEAITNGANISIRAGAILEATPFAPVTDDPITGATIAFNLATTLVALPVPVAETWYLVEARAVDTNDPAVARDVWDPGLAVRVPTALVKRVRRVIQFQVTGVDGVTTIPDPTGSTWTPLWGVRRPAGGGAVVNTDLKDLRPRGPVPTRLAGNGFKPGDLIRNQWATNILTLGAAATIRGQVSARTEDGDLQIELTQLIDPLNAAYLNPSDPAPIANEWWYLYLAPWNPGLRVRPRHAQVNVRGEGLFIFSRVAPNRATSGGTRFNGAVLTAPVPFGGASLITGSAVCFGALRRNAANTGWIGSSCVDGRVRFASSIAAASGAAPFVVFAATGGTTVLPNCARSFDARVRRTAVGVTPGFTLTDPAALVQSYDGIMAVTDRSSTFVLGADLTLGQAYDIQATADDLAVDILGYSL